MSTLTASGPLLDVYRLAELAGRVARECPVELEELAQAQRDLESAKEDDCGDRLRFAEARVEAREEDLVRACAALREAAGLRAAR